MKKPELARRTSVRGGTYSIVIWAIYIRKTSKRNW